MPLSRGPLAMTDTSLNLTSGDERPPFTSANMPCMSVRLVSMSWSVCTTTATHNHNPCSMGETLTMIGTTTDQRETPTWSATVTIRMWTGGGTMTVPPRACPLPTLRPTTGHTMRGDPLMNGHAMIRTTAGKTRSVITSYEIGSHLSASTALVGSESIFPYQIRLNTHTRCFFFFWSQSTVCVGTGSV